MHLNRLSRLLWPALLLLLCTGFYWKLLFTTQYSFLESGDMAYMELPRFQFQASEWHHSRFPLWNPHEWCGQPFLAQVLGAAYPPNWLLFLLPFREGKIRIEFVHWYFMLIHFFGALFCYLLCRDLKRSRPASLLAGLVFTLGGFLGTTDWPQVLNGAIWAPLMFLFLLRAVSGRDAYRSAAYCGTFVGISWLSGHHEAPIYITLAAAVTGLYFLIERRKERWMILRLGVLAGLFAVLTSGLQTLPAYEYAKLAMRWVGVAEPVAWNQPVPYTVHQNFSFTPTSLLGIISPGLFAHVNPFVGLAAFSLAVIGVIACWRRHPEARLFLGVTLGGLLLALGGSDVFHGMLYAVLPVFSKARVPARAIVVFSFGISILVAFGLDALRSEQSAVWLRRSTQVLAVVGGALVVVQFIASRASAFHPNEHLMLTGLVALTLAALFTAWGRGTVGAGLFSTALIALTLIEIGNVSTTNWINLATAPSTDLARLTQHNDIAQWLKAQPQPVRVSVNDQEIPYNFGDWHGINTLNGYMAAVTTNILGIETHTPRTQSLLGVGYSLDRKPSRPDQELVFRGASGINVYRNPNAFPRAWVVHQATQVATPGHLRIALQNPANDLRVSAPMLTAPPTNLEQCAGDEPVRITDMKAGRVRLEADVRCRGMLVLADTAYPGWKATVDGQPAQIYEPYGALRGVVLEPGTHHIEMLYRPTSALLGAAMTATGLLAACALALFRRRRPS